MDDLIFFRETEIPLIEEGQIEVEVRFQSKVNGKQIGGVEWYQFNHLKENLPPFSRAFLLDEKRSSQYEVWISSELEGERKSSKSSLRKVISEQGTTWYTKKRIKRDQINSEYNIKLSISQEISQKEPSKEPEFILKRNIDRQSYNNGLMYLDLSVVEETDLNSLEKSIKYEVELEYLDPNDPDMIVVLDEYSEQFWLFLHSSNYIYNQSGKEQLFQEINSVLYRGLDQKNISILGRDPRKTKEQIERYEFSNLRNLQMHDLVFGGIVGGSVNYRITYKTDGVRKLLIFNRDGYWLVGLNGEVNLLLPNYDSKINKNITIIDGEYTKSGDDKFFWMFDTLAANGKKVTEVNSHHKRLQLGGRVIVKLVKQGNSPLQEAESYIRNLQGKEYFFFNSKGFSKRKTGYVLCEEGGGQYFDIIRIVSKSFRQFHSRNDFFNLTQLMLNNIRNQEIPYSDDGLVFIPENTVYNTHSDSKPLYQRKLSDYPDICKWKPLEKITIDFKVFQKGKETELLSWDRNKKMLVPFEGSFFHPYIQKEEDLVDFPDGTIVEFGWDQKDEKFFPERIRSDKPKPNRLTVAQNNWDLIQDPITKEILTGLDHIRLVRKYHNRIKKKLFQDVQGKTLLDIGSGRGGDIQRWEKFDKIIAIEPDEDNLNELQNRIEKYDSKGRTDFQNKIENFEIKGWDTSKLEQKQFIGDKIHVIQAGGQDTRMITSERKAFIGEKVDVISMMLSMSFFWSSRDMLSRLAETIKENLKPNGTVIFLTIDGEKLDEYSGSTFFETKLNSWRFEGGVEIKYNSDQKRENGQGKVLYTKIPKTIVSTEEEFQEEYAVYLNELSLLIPNFELVSRHGARQDKFLTDLSLKFSSLYTYGFFKFVDSNSVYDYITLELVRYIPSLNLDIQNIDEIVKSKKDTITVNKKQITRVAVITGDSCIFHCLSQALMPSYLKASTYLEKLRLGWKLRHDLALTTKDYQLWSSAGQGFYQRLSENNKFDQKITFQQLNSSLPIGPEHYFYLADLTKCNLIVLRILKSGQIEKRLDIVNPGVDRYLVLSGYIRYYSLLEIKGNLVWRETDLRFLN